MSLGESEFDLFPNMNSKIDKNKNNATTLGTRDI